MSAKNFSIIVRGNDDELPVLSGAPSRSVGQLVKYFRSLVGGARRGAVTVNVKNDAVAATGTVTAATVVNGNTVTINGVTCTAAQLHATGTATFSTIVAGNKVTLNGVDFVARASPSLANEFALGASDTEAAANLAAAVNASTTSGITGVLTATSAAAVVTFRYYAQGTAGNAITLAKTGSPIAVSGATLANGAAKSGDQFCYKGSNAEVATDLASCINVSTTALIQYHVTAAASSAVVTLTAYSPGLAGNAVTLASSGGTLAVSGARLTGGTESLVTFTF